jgi:hypothetical protein
MTIKQTAGAFFFMMTITLMALSGCMKDDELNTDPAFMLGFSTDTVVFDTVFTSVGSSMRSLVIRNTGGNKINISRISLARGKSSPFRLNIDGTATEEYLNL